MTFLGYAYYVDGGTDMGARVDADTATAIDEPPDYARGHRGQMGTDAAQGGHHRRTLMKAMVATDPGIE